MRGVAHRRERALRLRWCRRVLKHEKAGGGFALVAIENRQIGDAVLWWQYYSNFLD